MLPVPSGQGRSASSVLKGQKAFASYGPEGTVSPSTITGNNAFRTEEGCFPLAELLEV
jgi:hypothetical protein